MLVADTSLTRPKKLAAGQEVDSFCTRCQLDLAHVIVAMDGARIARVQCKTCKTVHAHRTRAPAPRAPRGEHPRGRGSLSTRDYDRLTQNRDLSRPRPYRPATGFAGGDVLAHATFGVGVVNRVLADSKIEVAFPGGLRVLVHNRPA